MRNIYKYPVCRRGSHGPVHLTLHSDSKIIHAGIQGDHIMIWALVPPLPVDVRFARRTFQVLPTGGFVEETTSQHIATIMDSTPSGNYVWHLFEVK